MVESNKPTGSTAGHSSSGPSAAGLWRHGSSAAGPSPEMRRFAAGMRAIVAMLCTVLLATSGAGLGTPANLVMLAYDLWAGYVLWREARGNALTGLLAQHWIDITWTGLMLQFGGHGTELLILTTVQPVVLATIGFGVTDGVLLAAYAALWALVQVTPGALFEIRLSPWRTAPALALLALGPVVAALARPMSVLRSRLGMVRDIESRVDPRRGLGAVTTTLVTGLRSGMAADLAGIVLPTSADGPAWLCTGADGAFQASPAVHAQLETLLDTLPRVPVSHVARGARRWYTGTRLHGVGGTARAGPDQRDTLDALCRLLEVPVLVVVPLRRYDQRHGHLLIGRLTRRVRDQEIEALADAAAEMFRILEQAALVDHLVRETAAHERMRIGRDLHDSAIQPYLGLKYGLEALLRRVPADNPVRPDLQALAGVVDAEVDTLREVVSGLRNGQPTGDNALLPSVRRQVRHFAELFNIQVQLDCPDELPINRALAGAVFHLLNEALNNVRKHTHARSVYIGLTRQDGWLRLTVRDDAGTVLGQPAPDFQPRSLTERAQALGGMLSLLRPDGLNTEIVITVPLDAHAHP